MSVDVHVIVFSTKARRCEITVESRIYLNTEG